MRLLSRVKNGPRKKTDALSEHNQPDVASWKVNVMSKGASRNSAAIKACYPNK